MLSKHYSRYNEHWHKRWKVEAAEEDLLYLSPKTATVGDSIIVAKSILFCIFRLGLFWTPDRVSLSGQSVKSCWVYATPVVPKRLLVVVLKNSQAGPSLWDKCLVRHDLVIDFIFTVPPNFFICDGPNVSFIENCEDPVSWPKRLSTAQRDFPIAKIPHKLDSNYELPEDVAGRNFSNCCLQRKLSNGEVMQRKWLVHSTGKKFVSFFQ